MSSLGYSRESATPVSPFHAEPSARGREPVDGRECAIEAQDVRVDSVPGLGPVDAGPRLPGILGRSRRKGQTLASELGTDHFDPILDEPNLILHPVCGARPTGRLLSFLSETVSTISTRPAVGPLGVRVRRDGSISADAT
jgi:hypothetical protein